MRNSVLGTAAANLPADALLLMQCLQEHQRERTEKSQVGRKEGVLNTVWKHLYKPQISAEPGEGSEEIFYQLYST